MPLNLSHPSRVGGGKEGGNRSQLPVPEAKGRAKDEGQKGSAEGEEGEEGGEGVLPRGTTGRRRGLLETP